MKVTNPYIRAAIYALRAALWLNASIEATKFYLLYVFGIDLYPKWED